MPVVAAVQAAGGSVLGTGAGVQIGGWIIQSTSSSISGKRILFPT